MYSEFYKIYIKEMMVGIKKMQKPQTAHKRAARKIVDSFIKIGSDPDKDLFKGTLGWIQINGEVEKLSKVDENLAKIWFPEDWEGVFFAEWDKRVDKYKKDVSESGLDWKKFLDTQAMLSMANSYGDY